jgi:glycosyltransferase involved in cell wall biosynthesis
MMIRDASMIVYHIVESTATGTLSMLRLAANAQVGIGHKVAVVYSIRPETPDNLRALFDPRVELINIQMLFLKDKFRSLGLIRKIISHSKPNVVFMHSSFGGFLGRIATIGLPGKYYYLPHCISIMRQDITCIKRLLLLLLEWVGAIRDATYVACSESEGLVIERYIPFRPCIIVENAVDTASWHYISEWSARKRLVITVGQIRQQKDPRRFAKITKRILAKRNDVEFVWVGDGEPNFKQELRDAGVIVTGWKNPLEVKALLEGAAYYLSTSLWEGMPVSPIEAMLSGCVGILSDCAGNVDIVEMDKTGFIFSEIEEAVNQIEKLLDCPKLGNELSVAGREYCVKKYAVERYVREMNAIIKV